MIWSPLNLWPSWHQSNSRRICRFTSRLIDHITRVEVQLSDENSDRKGGNVDMRCVIEARLEGRQPIAVTDQAATLDQAIDGAAGKLARLIRSTLGRLRDQ